MAISTTAGLGSAVISTTGIGSASLSSSDASLPVTDSLILWLDATDASTITKDVSERVSQWDDKSSEGNDVTQGTTIEQPAFTASAIGGKPALRFAGNDFLVSAAYNSGTISQPNTAFVVINTVSASSNDKLFDGIDGSNRHVIQVIGSGDPDDMHLFAGIVISTGGGATPLDTDLVISGIFNGASSELFVNGTSEASGNAGSQSMAGIVVGSAFSQTGVDSYDGYIGELLMYDKLLSTSERQAVESYLTTKWNI